VLLLCYHHTLIGGGSARCWRGCSVPTGMAVLRFSPTPYRAVPVTYQLTGRGNIIARGPHNIYGREFTALHLTHHPNLRAAPGGAVRRPGDGAQPLACKVPRILINT
jgi:hypothetical protein